MNAINPLTIADVRPEVLRFALLMERKLRDKDAEKGLRGWKDCRPADLVRGLDVELGELRAEVRAAQTYVWRRSDRPSEVQGRLSRQAPDGRTEVADVDVYRVDKSPEVALRVALEAADVANYAMMVADASGGLDVIEPGCE